MNLLPVVEREFRVASRRRETWWLRLAFAAAALLAVLTGAFWPHTLPAHRGQVTLTCLAVGAFLPSLFAGAYLTADAISSERREGTLGLLFLTPLKGWQIVTGKMAGHALQVSAAWAASLPMLFLPLLQGGVHWHEIGRLQLALFTALMFSLSAGLLWSTLHTESRGPVSATLASLVLLTLAPYLPVLLDQLLRRARSLPEWVTVLSPMTGVLFAFEANYQSGLGGPWSGSQLYWLTVAVQVGLSLACLSASGRLLTAVWCRSDPGTREPRTDSAPARQTARHLGLPRWAQQKTISFLARQWARGTGRATPLTALRWVGVGFFAVTLVMSVSTPAREIGFIAAFATAYGLHLLARAEAALTATRRFYEEWRSGALELLLVTPVPDPLLVRAHHECLRGAFRGGVRWLVGLNLALEFVVIAFAGPLHMDSGAATLFTGFFVGGACITLADFAALRWLGMVSALRASTHPRAAGQAFARLVALPWLTFLVTWLVAMRFRAAEQAAVVFGGWVLLCLLHDALQIHHCRRVLRGGLRGLVQRAAEKWGHL